MNNEVKQESSGVERFTVRELWLGNDDHKQVVTAADHDRIVAEKDATITELREEVAQLDTQNGEVCCHGYAPYTPADYEVLVARAEAAEAKCAELDGLAKCRGCGSVLRIENSWMCDGCPCNCEAGTNHGLVPKDCCICDECHASSYRTQLRNHLAERDAQVAELRKERDGLRELLQEVREAFADGTLTSGPGNGKGKRYAIGIAAGIELALSQTKGWE